MYIYIYKGTVGPLRLFNSGLRDSEIRTFGTNVDGLILTALLNYGDP